ncbi:hypothetical protein FC700_24715 [Bacillus mycoides]|nr:hypothetical protein FC700_24715 [Bacillus mycoides]
MYIVLYFLLIFNIKTINRSCIYIEKFITKSAINDLKNESKLLAISLHSFPLILSHFTYFSQKRIE